MPRILTDLATIYMAVMYSEYFSSLGMQQSLYDPANGQFNKEGIRRAIDEALNRYADKFPNMKWDHNQVSYEKPLHLRYKLNTTNGWPKP